MQTPPPNDKDTPLRLRLRKTDTPSEPIRLSKEPILNLPPPPALMPEEDSPPQPPLLPPQTPPLPQQPPPMPFDYKGEGRELVCPHCWQRFNFSRMHYISRHPMLTGDAVLGPDAQRRFLPIRYNESGQPLDDNGEPCVDMACPRCHLHIPDAYADYPSLFFSIAGSPSSGKSYYLTALTHQLRSLLPMSFRLFFADSDASINQTLNLYEQTIFGAADDSIVALPKTALQGEDYTDRVTINGYQTDLPCPFIFSVTPMPGNSFTLQHEIVFYDNAGEHFEPGMDTIENLSTMHLANANGVIYLHDPLKDPALAKLCEGDDPQIAQHSPANQIPLLIECIGRIRKHRGLRPDQKFNAPFVVVIPKYDLWCDNFPVDLRDTDFILTDTDSGTAGLNMSVVFGVSYLVRCLLLKYSPALVSITEQFSDNVLFVPVSSFGHAAEMNPGTGMLGVRAGQLNPVWTEVPLFIMLYNYGLIEAFDQDTAAPPVTNYRLTGNYVTFTIPGDEEPQSLPITYLGQALFSTKTRQFFKLPDPPQTQNINTPDDASFWND